MRAAEQALEAGDLAAAVSLCEHGLATLDRATAASNAETLVAATPLAEPLPTLVAGHRPPDRSYSTASGRAATASHDAALSGSIHLLLAEAQRWRGAFAACEEAARTAMGFLPRGGRAWLRAVEEALVSAGRRGDREAVSALAKSADGVELDPAAAGAKMSCFCGAARHFLHAGDLAEADVWMARAQAVAEQMTEAEPRELAELHRLQGARARQLGDPVRDHEAYGKALVELVRAGDARAACNARTSFGFSCIQLGAYDQAERELRSALSEAERLGLESVRVRAMQNLGLVHLARGEHDRALALEEEVVAACRAQDNHRFEAWTRIYIAMIAERAGDGARAAAEAARAIPALSSAPSALAGALAIWARSLASQGDMAAAREKAAEALAILDRLGGIEEFEPLVRAAYARVFGSSDARAREVARAGAARLAEHAARIDGERERMAYLDGIAEHRELRRLAEG